MATIVTLKRIYLNNQGYAADGFYFGCAEIPLWYASWENENGFVEGKYQRVNSSSRTGAGISETLKRAFSQLKDAQFVIDLMPEKISSVDDLDEFTLAYVTCALWASNDESGSSGGIPMDRNYSVSDITISGLQRIADDCRKFQLENVALLIDDNCFTALSALEQAGHDFWLTRNGHGCGFWETDRWEKSAGAQLTKSAKQFGECNLYVDDDGKIDVQ